MCVCNGRLPTGCDNDRRTSPPYPHPTPNLGSACLSDQNSRMPLLWNDQSLLADRDLQNFPNFHPTKLQARVYVIFGIRCCSHCCCEIVREVVRKLDWFDVFRFYWGGSTFMRLVLLPEMIWFIFPRERTGDWQLLSHLTLTATDRQVFLEDIKLELGNLICKYRIRSTLVGGVVLGMELSGV